MGSFLEIVEFLIDLMFKPEVHYQLNLVDTDLDLVSDVLGAIIAACHLTAIDFAKDRQPCRN